MHGFGISFNWDEKVIIYQRKRKMVAAPAPRERTGANLGMGRLLCVQFFYDNGVDHTCMKGKRLWGFLRIK